MIIDINDAVARYTLGAIVISLLATMATWVVLSILGVRDALPLGRPAVTPAVERHPTRR